MPGIRNVQRPGGRKESSVWLNCEPHAGDWSKDLPMRERPATPGLDCCAEVFGFHSEVQNFSFEW